MRGTGALREVGKEVLRKGGNEIVETGATAGGVPDSEYCSPYGRQGWLEF
jgi:hypothetical protein